MANDSKADTARDILRQAQNILKKSSNTNVKKASDYLDEAIRLIKKG